MVTQIYKIRSEIWLAPPPEIWWPKNIKPSARFRTTSRLDREQGRSQEFAKGDKRVGLGDGRRTEVPQRDPGSEPRWRSGGEDTC